VVVVVGGAMLKRARAARAMNVASTQTVDSAASGLGTPSAPTAIPSSASFPPSSSASNVDKPDSADANGFAADSATSKAPVAPPALIAGAGAGLGSRVSERRAEKDAPRTSKPSVVPAPPPMAPPAPPVQPSAATPSPTPSVPASAEQARAAVDAAGTMIANDKPAEAMLEIRGALPLLSTRDDSVTALYYLAHAMIQRSAKTGEAASRQRACSILTLIAKATAHPKAAEIRSLTSQECK
jgi:hypothetical protein